ncbi:hypothetical protein LTR04_007176, partial [Oleoguttula sp. CCFEE 6159]
MQSFLQYRRIGEYVRNKDAVDEAKKPNAIDVIKLRPWTSRSDPSLYPHSGSNLEGATFSSVNPTFQASTHPAYGQSQEFILPGSEPTALRFSSAPSDRGSGQDPIEVHHDGSDDPTNPHNWSLPTRCKNLAIVALLVFVQGWAGGADSLGNKTASEELHVSRVSEDLVTALYLVGVGLGALFSGPLSESFGRNPTYLGSVLCSMLFIMGSALVRNFATQIVCRFFVGLFASATLTINGSSMSDQFEPLERSLVWPWLALANIAAPMLAPVAGGWIVENLGWRYTEWITLAISGFAFLIAFFFLPETFSPLLVSWKARHMRNLAGSDKEYTCELEERSGSMASCMWDACSRPVVFFTREPVIIVLGLYLIVLYAIVFSFLQGFDYLFTMTYDFSTRLTGSAFAAIAAGAVFSTLLSPIFALVDRKSLHRRKVAMGSSASLQAETRLWPSLIAAPTLPISLFWLGWTNYPSISPWSSLGACFLFGYALMSIYVSSYQYIIDSYAAHAASALASITMARYVIAAGLVMAARPMYSNIGTHWTLTWMG